MRAELGSGSRREPLVSGVRLFKGALGLLGASGCFWRLWEGGRGMLVVGRSNPDASPPLKQKGKVGLQCRRAGSVLRGPEAQGRERASSESDLKNAWPGQNRAQGSQLPAFVRTALI